MPLSPPPQGTFRYPLSRIFRTEAGVRVLRELVRHGGPLDTARLMRATKLTRMTVLSTLAHLTSLGIVETMGSGRYGSYQANAAHPLFPALAQVFDAEAARVQRVYDALRSIAESMTPAVSAVWLYGSAARGEDRAGSDVDIAVVTRDAKAVDRVASAFRDQLEGVESRERVLTSIVALSNADVRRLAGGDPWWRELERDAVPLVGAPPTEYSRQLTAHTPSRRQHPIERAGDRATGPRTTKHAGKRSNAQSGRRQGPRS